MSMSFVFVHSVCIAYNYLVSGIQLLRSCTPSEEQFSPKVGPIEQVNAADNR